MDILYFVYPLPVDGHLDCVPFLAIMNNAAMNISAHIVVWADWGDS